MWEIIIRFVVGGLVVSVFALLSDVLKPKSFAGLFGAAPSVALATNSLTVIKNRAQYAATETRSMIIGALAFLVYACLVSRARHGPQAHRKQLKPCANTASETNRPSISPFVS